VRNDGIKNYDMTLSKWFPIKGEALKMQLRADAFNLFNRTQFGNPNTQLGSPNFGVVTSVFGPPRFIQLGARLQW
jgi:outer membrane receptor protein involved in Fe transport